MTDDDRRALYAAARRQQVQDRLTSAAVGLAAFLVGCLFVAVIVAQVLT